MAAKLFLCLTLCLGAFQVLGLFRAVDAKPPFAKLGPFQKNHVSLEKRLEQLEMTLNTFIKAASLKKIDVTGRIGALEKQMSALRKSQWTMKRIMYQFPRFDEITLSPTNTGSYAIPTTLLASNTKVVVVAIKCSEWKELSFNKVLSISLQQNGNKYSGKTELDAPMSDFYYELMVPWNTARGNKLDITITGETANIYSIRVVGYIA